MKLSDHLEGVAIEAMHGLFNSVPCAGDFHQGLWIDKGYYVRHLMETVLRIRLNNEVDAFCLYQLADKDNVLAALFSQYLAEEYGHEGMFLADLDKFGVSKACVDQTPPFFSTDQLIGYLYLSVKRDGPLPTMIWNWFVEWYSARYNKIIINKVIATYGDPFGKGFNAHINIDEAHDHDDLMWKAANRAVEKWGSAEKAEIYLRNFVQLLGAYFTELYDTSVDMKKVA